MIQTSSQSRVFVAIEPIDFRKRMDGTAGYCRLHLAREPLDGAIYVFKNKRSSMIRLYFFDGWSEWCCDIRIAKGNFRGWPKSEYALTGLQAHDLQVLIRNGNVKGANIPEAWKKL